MDGEFNCGIAGLVDIAVRGRQAERETLGVDVGKFGDVIRHGAITQIDLLGTNPVQIMLHQLGHRSESSREPTVTTMSLSR
ncbi:hypothetical protein GCM10009632_44520 [Mycolicibacterium alvei]|uniref:Uncharacterized protein n=1 Tax=Mycolicibacterium alvei TaxID=67081 RepID=A0A6N4V2V9_9MYCO|nr:hypothetical protein MALV_51160 [Mycolicibacterium alvei]